MKLAAIVMDPAGRKALDDAISAEWQDNALRYRFTFGTDGDVIIGSGYHAAVWAAARVKAGKPKPTVLERNVRAGGVFAVSDQPVFYLNSRNYPGSLGIPGEGSALNYIPGAPLQPAMLSGAEFQTNADMALVIRMALAEYATVIPGAEVTRVETDANPGDPFGEPPFGRGVRRNISLDTTRGAYFTSRLVDARGLGDPRLTPSGASDGRVIVTYPEFMQRMGKPFPLRSLNKVAVIGGGDSAKSAVMSLLGIGPNSTMNSMGLDYVRRVDLYAPNLPSNCDAWKRDQRFLYQPIGHFLRNKDGENRRLRVFNETGNASRFLDQGVVNQRYYDLVVIATGYELPDIPGLPGSARTTPISDPGGLVLARKSVGDNVYRVGPAANLGFNDFEYDNGIANIPENRTAMFRMGPRTALLASTVERFE